MARDAFRFRERLRRTARSLPVATVILFAASLALFACGVRAFGVLQDARANTSTFTCPGAGIAQHDTEAARQAVIAMGYAGDVVLWSQDDSWTVFAADAPSAVDIAVVNYVGDLGLLLPNLTARPTDPGMCVLSSAASERLFATTEATGRSVLVAGATHQVVDTVASDTAFLVRVGGELVTGDEPAYTRVTARARDTDGFPLTADLLAPILGTRVQELDYAGFALLAHGCLFLYPLTLVVALVTTGCRAGSYAHRESALAGRVVCGAAAIGGAIGATLAFASSLTVFGGYYPTRWSDFPAWQEAIDAWTSGLARLALSRQTVFDEPVVAAGVQAVLFAALALVTLLAAFWQLRGAPSSKHAHHVRK